MGVIRIEATIEDARRLFRRRKKKRPAHDRVADREPAASASSADIPLMKLAPSAYERIMHEIGGRPPESGGVLIGPKGEKIATHFVFDETGVCTGASWTFGHERLNEILRQYLPLGLDAKGFVHSHPSGFRRLSSGDMLIPRKAFANTKNADLSEVWMPIVVDRTFFPFIVFRSALDQPAPARLVLI